MKSWNEIRKAATAFSKRWKNAYDEKAQAQSSLKEFFAVFGVDTVVFNAFEHRVKFTDGSQGYADCFWQGKILVEMKSAGRDLDAAYTNVAGYGYGYTITTPNGDTIRRVVDREEYRRSLVTNCTTYFNSSLVDSNVYAFDALSRPVARSTGTTGVSPVASAFAYNDRSEVLSAAIGTNRFTHAYDNIGNHLLFGDNAVTNTYTHNNLNQITASLRPPASPQTIHHNADGGLSSDGIWSYAYDAEDQLRSVTSRSLTNGAIRVRNTYDYRRRRISKTVQRLNVMSAPPPALPVELREWETLEMRSFVYDDWNLIHETVYTVDNGVTNATEIQYFWGLDLSGTIQGAGGVGGLLAVSRNGQLYFPAYDNNGNFTKYIEESGNVVAAYEYDDFSRIISQSGPLADFFRHRFSTKYYDPETGLYYYGMRFYAPEWRVWLNRDTMEESGGVNMYMLCGNNPISRYDVNGQNWFTCFGDCIEEWRLDWGNVSSAINATASLNAPVPKTPAERIWIKKGVSENTTELSRVISQGERLARKLPLGNPVRTKIIQSLGNLRRVMRNPALVKAGAAGAALTVFEGFYDMGAMLYCSIHCCGE